MTDIENYFVPLIGAIIALIITSYIPRYGHKQWGKWGTALGCLVQPIAFIIVMIAIIAPYSGFRSCENEEGTMICIRNIEEDRDCRFEEMWYLKTDGSISYHYDKGSNSHHVEPCGNDNYWGNLDEPFVRIDSVPMLTFHHFGDIKVYLDLENRKVTPTFNNDTIEVVYVYWDAIDKYFNTFDQ